MLAEECVGFLHANHAEGMNNNGRNNDNDDYHDDDDEI
jgi:hypothetical protein